MDRDRSLRTGHSTPNFSTAASLPIGVCFVSAFGGAGRSFLASHLASGLSRRSAADVGLVDVTPAGTWNALPGLVSARDPGLVSCWQIDPNRASLDATLARLSAIISRLHTNGVPAIVELPVGAGPLTAFCVSRAAVIYVVTDCTVAGLVGTSRLLRWLADAGADSRVQIVANRTQPWLFGSLSRHHAEQHLARHIAYDIPFDSAVHDGEFDLHRLDRRTGDALEAMVQRATLDLGAAPPAPLVECLSA